MMKRIYLDYAAATPLDERVLAAMQPYYADKFQNPSAAYLPARAVKAAVESARRDAASVLGTKPNEVIFTAGGTEANNLAVIGIAQDFPGSHIVTTALEHDSVLAPVNFLEARGWTKTEVKPGPDGVVDPRAIAKAITSNTVLVSVMYANNEIGTIQPLHRISAGLESIREQRRQAGSNLPLYLHTDACQAANYLDLHVHRLGVDLMTLNGGKIYGPKQSGALWAASHVRLTPIIHGGGQEYGLRSGTENVPAIIGFAKALMIAEELRHTESTRLHTIQKLFFEQLRGKIPNLQINGSLAHRLPNNVHVTLPGTDNERLLFGLDEAGVQCAAGSACSASKAEPSHGLKAVGLSDEDARASLRFTMGRGTDESEIIKTASILAKLVA